MSIPQPTWKNWSYHIVKFNEPLPCALCYANDAPRPTIYGLQQSNLILDRIVRPICPACMLKALKENTAIPPYMDALRELYDMHLNDIEPLPLFPPVPFTRLFIIGCFVMLYLSKRPSKG